MPSSTRKEREVRAREALILDVAQEMLLERGYIGLTMDRVAAATEYSKGTIYQHFANKEDLLAAVAHRSSEIRSELFERAASFRGRSRERMGAVGAAAELFLRLYPHHEQAEKIVKSSSIRAKVDEKRAQALAMCEYRCFGVATGIVRDAIAQGDLELRADQTPEHVSVGLWNLYMGAFLMKDLGLFLDEPALADPMPALLANAQVFLDGCGWRPLSREVDYLAARERALREVFPDEAHRAGLL